MNSEDDSSRRPAAGKPVGKFERQVTRPSPTTAKPAEVVVFKPLPRTDAQAANAPAAKRLPPPAPNEPSTEDTPLAPAGKRIRLIEGAGKVRYFALPKPPLPKPPPPVAAEPPATAATKQPLPPAPAATPAAPAAPAPKPVPPPACAVKRLKLTDRDRQLMGLVATARYLSLEHLHRLISPGRNLIDLRKRTLALAGEGKYGVEQPYLKRMSYRNYLGEPETAWMLTPLGYNVAETVLATPPRRPSSETGANFIEHGLLLNELYVQLLEAPLKRALATARARAAAEKRPSRGFDRVKAGLYARAAHPQFRWQSHDEVRLPWREYEVKSGKTFNRVIIPDATLVIPGRVMGKDVLGHPREYAGRRYFLEAETGSHTVVAEGDTKPGATLNKVERYVAFISPHEGFHKPTWYTKEYPDDFEPILLFLVRSEGRQATVNRALKEHQSQGGYRIRAHALTVDLAAAELLTLLGPAWGEATATTTATRVEQPRRPAITSGEYRLLRSFIADAFKVIQGCRAVARTSGLAVPEYPNDAGAVEALVKRLDARK